MSRSTCWVSVSVREDDANRIIIQSAEFTNHLSFNHPCRLLVIFSPQHLLSLTRFVLGRFKHLQDSGFTCTMECFVDRRDPPHCQFPVEKRHHFVRLGFVGRIFFFYTTVFTILNRLGSFQLTYYFFFFSSHIPLFLLTSFKKEMK